MQKLVARLSASYVNHRISKVATVLIIALLAGSAFAMGNWAPINFGMGNWVPINFGMGNWAPIDFGMGNWAPINFP